MSCRTDTTVQAEEVMFRAPLESIGDPLEMFEEKPLVNVIWDDEFEGCHDLQGIMLEQLVGCGQYSIGDELQHGKQLAGCVDCMDEETKPIANPNIHNESPHVNDTHFPLELHVNAFSDVSLENEVVEKSELDSVVWNRDAQLLDEWPCENVVWDEELQFCHDSHVSLLEQLPKSMVDYSPKELHHCGVSCQGQVCAELSNVISEEIKPITKLSSLKLDMGVVETEGEETINEVSKTEELVLVVEEVDTTRSSSLFQEDNMVAADCKFWKMFELRFFESDQGFDEFMHPVKHNMNKAKCSCAEFVHAPMGKMLKEITSLVQDSFSPWSKVNEAILENVPACRYGNFSPGEDNKKPEIFIAWLTTNFSMRQWDPGICKLTLLDASIIWGYITMVLVSWLGGISAVAQFMEVFLVHAICQADVTTQLAYKTVSIDTSICLRLRVFLESVGLILMEFKLFFQDGQTGILCAILETKISSLHISMPIQMFHRAKGLVAAGSQNIFTANLTKLLAYLRHINKYQAEWISTWIWDTCIPMFSLHDAARNCLIADILWRQWANRDKDGGSTCADHGVAWGQATFWRGGSVTPGPSPLGLVPLQSSARPTRYQQLYKRMEAGFGRDREENISELGLLLQSSSSRGEAAPASCSPASLGGDALSTRSRPGGGSPVASGCDNEHQNRGHRRDARHHAAALTLLPPRDASPLVLAAAWSKPGAHSVHAARVFDGMWSSNFSTAESLRASRAASMALFWKQDDLCLVSDLKDLAVCEESRYLIMFFATHLIGVEMLGCVSCVPLDENELEVQMQQPWPPLAVLLLQQSPWPLFDQHKMLQLLDACLALASSSTWLGGMWETVIVGSQQNDRSSQSLVSCGAKVCIADSMIEVFIDLARSWSEKAFLSDGFLLESSAWHNEFDILMQLKIPWPTTESLAPKPPWKHGCSALGFFSYLSCHYCALQICQLIVASHA